MAQVQQARAAGNDIESLLTPERPRPRQAQAATTQAGVAREPVAQVVAGRGGRHPALVVDALAAAQEVAVGRQAPAVVANNQVILDIHAAAGRDRAPKAGHVPPVLPVAAPAGHQQQPAQAINIAVAAG